MPDIKAIVFDMDGVLFDTERLCSDAWRKVATQRNIQDIETPINECVGRNEQDMKCIMKRIYGEDFPFEEFMGAIADCFYAEVEQNGMPIMKGVPEILEYLRAHDYRIALASSSTRKSVEFNLQTAGIQDYFEVLVTGDMVTHGKPDPEIYSRACKELRILPENAIAIEDSYNGIRSAHAAGMYPIMVPDMLPPTEEMNQLAFKICDSLPQIIQVLDEL